MKPSSIITNYAGRFYRYLPYFRGKHLLSKIVMEPLFRKKNIEHILELPGGKSKFSAPLMDWIPWQVFLYGCYLKEKEEGSFMLSQIRDGHVIVDIGANLGYYSIQFAEKAGLNGSVYSFEPLSYQMNYLKQNVALNRLTNITLEKKIVSDTGEEKKIYFSNEKNSGLSSVNTPTNTFENIPCIRLDDYCRQNDIERIDLVKVDVEGHEYNVVKGMQGLLTSNQIGALFIEVNDENLRESGSSRDELVGFLADRGYKAYKISGTGLSVYRGNQEENLVYFSPRKNIIG